MSSTGQIEFTSLTPDNGAVMDLKELLFLTVLQSEAFEKTINLFPGAIHGHKLGGVGKMGPVGTKQPNCQPTWNSTNIKTQEKEWDLGEWTVAEQICYKDLEETLVRYAMRSKTDIADLTGTDFMDIIVEPKLTEAMIDMVWRLYWFGDKSAANVQDGGIITNGIDTELFKVCDGFFKRLFAITAANPKQRIEIAANTAASYQLQRDGIRAAGIATGIMDDLVYNSDIRIRQAKDKAVLCTQSFADALAIDVKRTTGSDLQWESLFDGLVSATKFNGQDIIALPKWDEMIAAYEDNGTTLNLPHRVLYAPKSNLLAGIASNNLIALLKTWFSEDDQVNRMLAKDKVGTLIWEDELIQFAY